MESRRLSATIPFPTKKTLDTYPPLQKISFMYKYIILAVLCLLTACSYSVFLNTYPHLKNVQISPFENETSEYTIAQDFQEHLVNKFQNDGRLRISTIDPDSRVEGSVLDYKNEVYGYNYENNVTEYRVTILFSVIMTDLREEKTMYENKSMMISEVYMPNSDNPEHLKTENEAIEKVFDKVFDTLIRSTLEAW